MVRRTGDQGIKDSDYNPPPSHLPSTGLDMSLVVIIARQADLGRIVLDLVVPRPAGWSTDRGIVGGGSGATYPGQPTL